jgi:sarcosine oxidase
MTGAHVADVIVIGLGAFGSATAYQLAKAGARVIGIDQFTPPHDRGSSHGATRITRLAVGEGDVYVPLVRRSNEIWQELEAASGSQLYLRTGGLIMGPQDGNVRHHGKPDFVRRTVEAAVRYGIPHELLDASEVRARFPQFMTRGDELAYFEPDSGVLKPELCVQTQLKQAAALGATLRYGEAVTSMSSTAGGVTVKTVNGTCSAAKVIVTAGPWVPGMVGGRFATHLRVMRQVLYWYETKEPALYASPSCPVFIWMHGSGDEDYMYGFPMVDSHPGVKVATEQYQVTTDPDETDRQVSDVEKQRMFELNVSGRLRSVTSRCVHAASCLYTVSTDSGFIVDAHPEVEHVTVVSACSGHGFKHSAALGEHLARQATSQATEGLAPFSLARFSGRW